MKTHICLVLLSVMTILPVCGCGRSAQKPAPEPTFAEESSLVRYTTQRRRNPQTGHIETIRVPVQPAASAEAAPATARRRATARARAAAQPEGRPAEMRRRTVGRQPTPAAEEPVTATARRAAAARARAAAQTTAAAETQPAEPQEKKFEVSWQEACSVQKAFEATNELLYERLRLEKVFHIAQNRRTRQEPVADHLSAVLKARSAIGVVFDVTISLLSSDSCTIMIKAISTMQPAHVLETHSLFIKEKISEAIDQVPEQVQAAEEKPPYPETVFFDHPVGTVFDAIYAWAEEQGFQRGSTGRDKYFKVINCEAGSGIQFRFTLRLIGPNKTKLNMQIFKFEDKEEFPMILQSLKEALTGLKDVQTYTGSDTADGEDVFIVP